MLSGPDLESARKIVGDLGGQWHATPGTAPCPACRPERRRVQHALRAAAGVNGRILLHCFGEAREVSGREVGAGAYILSKGAGKIRANRSGIAPAAARWRVMELSSGQISLVNKMAEAGTRPAARRAVRLLDVTAGGRAPVGLVPRPKERVCGRWHVEADQPTDLGAF